MIKKLYLDIDGVILTKRNIRQAEHLRIFIDFILTNFDCYWLTTHCKSGVNKAIPYLKQYLDSSMLEELKKVNSTDWDTLKTEAIDFTSDFLWLDDSPMQVEINYLKEMGREGNLILIDLNNKDELLNITKILEKDLGES